MYNNFDLLTTLYELPLIGGCVSMASSANKEGNKEIFQWTYEEMITLCDTSPVHHKTWSCTIFRMERNPTRGGKENWAPMWCK